TWTRLYQNDLLKLCVGLLPDDLARAEEIAEDTLRKAVDEGYRIQDLENFSVFPWLITIARNLCSDEQRTDKRARGRERTFVGSTIREEMTPEDWVAFKEALALVGKLDYNDREIILLRSLGFNYKDIANILGISHDAARQRGVRAFQNLAK